LEAIIADRNSAPKGCLAGAGFPDVKIFDKQKGGGQARGLKCCQFIAIHTGVQQGVYSGIADGRMLDVGLNPGYDPSPLIVAYFRAYR
jgi:hypothetical protein